MKSTGFALIWVIIVAFVLLVMIIPLFNTSVARSRSSELKIANTLAQITRENDLNYASRLLVANADSFLKAAAVASSAHGPVALDTPATYLPALQTAFDALCNRDPDGKGGSNRIRVYVTTTACGQPLPGDVTLLPPILTSATNSRVLKIPFVLDTEDQTGSAAGHAVVSGVINVAGGSGSVSQYAFYLQRNTILSDPLTVNGPAFIAGMLTVVNSNLAFNGGLTITGCVAAVRGCTSDPVLGTMSQFYGSTSLQPDANHFCLPGKCVAGTILPAAGTDPVGDLTPSTLMLAGAQISLGVTPDNRQRIIVCSSAGSICTEYQTYLNKQAVVSLGALNSNGSLTQTADPWDGVINLANDITVSQITANQPAVAARFTLRTNGNITINSNLILTDPSCATGVCGQTADSNMLGLVAGGGVDTSTGVTDVMAAISAPECLHAVVPLRILGSLHCTYPPSGTITIGQDPRFRADRNLAPPGLPPLADDLRMTQVVFK